jgi:copper chaperone
MATTTTVHVNGMTCEHCVAAVREEIAKLDAVDSVSVDLGSGAVTIVSAAPLDDAAVHAAVDEAGYELA